MEEMSVQTESDTEEGNTISHEDVKRRLGFTNSGMKGKRLIEKIRLRNILSFGDKGEEIELLSLNVIIGQNASGKSNLIDVLKLLRSLPKDRGLVNFISRNGGINEWVWKGKKTKNYAQIDIALYRSNRIIAYEVKFGDEYDRSITAIIDEVVRVLFHNEDKIIKIVKRQDKDDIPFGKVLSDEEERQYLNYDESILSGAFLKNNFDSLVLDLIFMLSKFVVFTDLQTNRKTEMRKPQLPDAPNNFLEEDANNLALVLNDLEHRGDTKDKIVENLKKFNPLIKDYSIRMLGGTVQLFIREEGLEKPISAMRLSDGTLRYLCLLAILCHPEPPPLICIEEPETGLHPDILPTIAELMIEASQRTQLIVTTHSDILVSAFSDMPEAVLVCEKDEDGTHFKRLEAEKLKVWLEEYTLGEAWLRGAIGGTRW